MGHCRLAMYGNVYCGSDLLFPHRRIGELRFAECGPVIGRSGDTHRDVTFVTATSDHVLYPGQ